MTTIIDLFEIRKVRTIRDCESLFKGKIAPEEKIESERVIGIEIEVENTLLKKTPCLIWQQITDGSLRNNGMEYITHPIPAIWAPQALNDLLADSFEQDCCFSPRTSTHVHVNCQDLTIDQVKDSVLMYSCLEEFFYQFTGRGRIKNIYCVPLFDTNLMTEFSSQKIEHTLDSWSKYTGLNLLPLRDKGTIEFRHMHGTFDTKKLIIWIRMITKLIDYCVKMGTKAIRKFVFGFNSSTDVLGLMVDIFGSDVDRFKNIEYATIKCGVEATKLAFTKPEIKTQLLKNLTKAAPYFTGVK